MDAGYLGPHRGPSVAGDGTIRALAEAAVLGLPVERMYRSRDGDEKALLNAVRTEAGVVVNELMDSLARKIVKEYSEAQERGRKKSAGKSKGG